MSAPQAMSIVAAGRIAPPRRIASRTARGRGCAVERGAGRPHHARSVSISRSTCVASARSNSSAAISSASARIVAAAFRRAASMRAARTAVEIGVPSLVKTSSAREASASGRKVMVSATKQTVLQYVRQCAVPASLGLRECVRWCITEQRILLPAHPARYPDEVADKTEIIDNRFTVCSARPNTTMCWQVTGVRKDPWAEAHRIQVEEPKTGKARGAYSIRTTPGICRR